MLPPPVSSYCSEQPVPCPGGLSVSREVVERRNVPWAPLNKKNSHKKIPAQIGTEIGGFLLLEVHKFTCQWSHFSCGRSEMSRGHGLARYLCVLSAVCADKYVGFHNKYFRLTATRVLSLYCGFGFAQRAGVLENGVSWNKKENKSFLKGRIT